MAVRWLIATGVTSDPANWNGGTLPTASDTCHANGFTGTINSNLAVVGIYTTSDAGAIAGGGWILNDGVTLSVIDAQAGTTNCIIHSGTGVSYIIGIIKGSTTGPSSQSLTTVNNTNGQLYITGNILPSTVNGNTPGNGGSAVRNSNGYLEITGIISPANNSNAQTVAQSGTGTLKVIGRVVGGGVSPAIRNLAGTVTVDEVQFSNSVVGTVGVMRKMIFNTLNASPGGFWHPLATPVIEMYDLNNQIVTLSDAVSQGQPAESNVRFGVIYAAGTRTGTCAVPPAGAVSLGVPVGTTTGTGSVTSAEIRDLILPSILSAITAP